jgi:coproporphyrinogen III oxidase-like Fe-S oxidoreductase
VKDIAVLDPLFNIGRHGCDVLEQFVGAGFQGHLSLQCRMELIDEAFVQLAAGLDTTLEFGLQTIHAVESDAVERRNDMAKAERGLRLVLDRGVKVEVSLIFGLPTQTLASFTQSVQWALDAGVRRVKAFPLMLLRGTKLALEREKWGLVEDDHSMPVVVESNSFDQTEWRHMAKIAAGLRVTEGCHPRRVAELAAIGEKQPVDFGLWRPT